MTSFSQPHVIAASSAADLAAKVDAFVQLARLSAEGGLSIAEFSELCVALMRLCIAAVDSILAEGAAKKQFVLDAVGMLYDAVADKVVPLPLYPIWIFLRSPVRWLVLAIASGCVESILPLVRGIK